MLVSKRQKFFLRLNKITALLLSFLCYNLSQAETTQPVEFNTDLLDMKDKNNIDLKQFSRAGFIMPGNYTMSLHINKDELPEQEINWYVPKNDPNGSEACLTPETVKNVGLKKKYEKELRWQRQGECLDPASLPGMIVRGDIATSSLYLSIPQIYLQYSAPNWDPPSRWDDGINGMMFDYYLNTQASKSRGEKLNSLISGNGTAGINIGAWRLRADWQGQYDADSRTHARVDWDWSRYYAFRALPSLGAKLTVGETSLYSDIFDGFRFTGASLQTEDNMLPPNLRGYAPEVTGVAKTNARVVISQQGRVLKETQVAAGPFRIQDLNSMVNGELEVRVEEQDGSVQNFTINTASVPYLTRPGMVRYKLATGRSSDSQHHTQGPIFASGEFSWGVNNGWSLYGGGITAEDYNALALGIGRDLLALGALSFDATSSRAVLPHSDEKLSGASYRMSYSKRFDTTDSQVTFAGYRFSTHDFISMGDYLDALNYGRHYGKSKEMYTVTFNQQLRDLGLSIYLNYNHESYWDQPNSDRYTLTLAKGFDLGNWHNLNLSASVFSNSYYGTSENGMYLSLNVPLGTNGSVSYGGNLDRTGSSHSVDYYTRRDNGDSYRLGMGETDGQATLSGNYSHSTRYVDADASFTYNPERYSYANLSMRGGLTATMQGAALHNNSNQGGTRMLIDTDGVADVPIGGTGSQTWSNRFGKAVVTGVGSYYRSRVSIDLNALPDNAEIANSVVQGTLTEGAIGYRKFEVVSGEKAMATLHLADGSTPPLGAMVVNEKHQHVGIVNDDGSVYLSGIHDNEKMSVQWDGEEQCQITLPAGLKQDLTQGLFLPCTAPKELHTS